MPNPQVAVVLPLWSRSVYCLARLASAVSPVRLAAFLLRSNFVYQIASGDITRAPYDGEASAVPSTVTYPFGLSYEPPYAFPAQRIMPEFLRLGSNRSNAYQNINLCVSLAIMLCFHLIVGPFAIRHHELRMAVDVLNGGERLYDHSTPLWYFIALCVVGTLAFWGGVWTNSVPIRYVFNRTFRDKVRSLTVIPLQPIAGAHSHPVAASKRNAGDQTINDLIASAGYEAYSIQASGRDDTHNIAGSRLGYFDGDLVLPYKCDVVKPHHIFKMCNVDYYVDWLSYLWMCRPFVMLTCAPIRPCGSTDNLSWTFTGQGGKSVLSMKVEGSGSKGYSHELWDYNVDYISATYPGVRIIYHVETVRLDDVWAIVSLIPGAAVSCCDRRAEDVNFCTCAASMTLKRREVVKLVECMDGRKRLAAVSRSIGTTGFLSLSIPGTYESYDVTPDEEVILKSRATIAMSEKKTLKVSDIPQILSLAKSGDVRKAQGVVFSCFPIDGCEFSVSSSRESIEERSYEPVSYGRWNPDLISGGAGEKFAGVQLCPPVITNSSLYPKKSRANDLWCVDGRITSIHSKQKRFAAKYEAYKAEFLALLVPDPHENHPAFIGAIVDNLPKKAQRDRVEAKGANLAGFMDGTVFDTKRNANTSISSMQKSESYDSAKDPRNISTFPDEFYLWGAQFVKPLGDHLKLTEWYAFGLHPDELARRIHARAVRSKTITEGDLSRFDGRHSHALYTMEKALYLRFFRPEYHAQIEEWHKRMTNAKARTDFGVYYDPDGSRPSGSVDTSVSNSVCGAYFAYCTHRQMGKSPAEAYAAIGFHGGDDTLAFDISEKAFVAVCADLDQKMVAFTRPVDEPTSLLGRVYPCPVASPQHIAQVPRMAKKLHTHHDKSSGDQKNVGRILVHKAMGILATDLNTPVLSDWATKVVQLYPKESGEKLQATLLAYAARDLLSESGKLTAISLCEPGLALSDALRQLDITTVEYTTWLAKLQACTRIEDFPVLIDMPPPVIPPGTTVGGVAATTATPPATFRPGGDFNLMTGRDDQARLAKLLGTKATTVLEMCAHRGNDSLLLATTLPTARITIMDSDTASAGPLGKLKSFVGDFMTVKIGDSVAYVASLIEPPEDTFHYSLVYLDPPWNRQATGTFAPSIAGKDPVGLAIEMLNKRVTSQVILKYPSAIPVEHKDADITVVEHTTDKSNVKFAVFTLKGSDSVEPDDDGSTTITPTLSSRPSPPAVSKASTADIDKIRLSKKGPRPPKKNSKGKVDYRGVKKKQAQSKSKPGPLKTKTG